MIAISAPPMLRRVAEATVRQRRQTGIAASLDSAQRRLAEECQTFIGVAGVKMDRQMVVTAPVRQIPGSIAPIVPSAPRRNLLQGNDIRVEAHKFLACGVQSCGLAVMCVPEVPGCDLHPCSPEPGTTSTACGQGWIRNGPRDIASRIEWSSVAGHHSSHHVAPAAAMAAICSRSWSQSVPLDEPPTAISN